jgi:L-rhamnose isomerase
MEMGLLPEPIAAYRASGYQEKVAAERGSARPQGSGYEGA